MRGIRVLIRRVVGTFGRARRDRELAEEIESHIQLHVADAIRRGATPAQARREAILRFGPVEAIKESYRERRGLPLVESLVSDLRIGARLLIQRPGFAAVAILTLALGIGGTTTIFSVVDPLFLRPLPYPDPGRLVEVHRVWPDGNAFPSLDTGVWERLRRRLAPEVFDRMEATVPHWGVVVGTDRPEEVRAQAFTPGLFPLLGARPLLGRLFTESDAEARAGGVVVLGESVWRRLFDADPGVLGRTISYDGIPLTVIGVLPHTFRYPYGIVEMWMPLRRENPILPLNGYEAIGRLAPGISREAAQARIDALGTFLADEHPRPESGRLLSVVPLDRSLDARTGDAINLLAGAVACMLLIACVNVAGLMLVRAGGREAELAVRRSLGATGGRLFRQMITESLLLAAIGGALGVLLGHVGVRLLVSVLPESLVHYTQATIAVDARVLLFAGAVTTATGVAFGVLPALRATHERTLGDGAGRTTAPPAVARMGAGIVVAQLALSMALLVGTGLLARSFAGLLAVDPGFHAPGLLVLDINLASYRYPDGPAADAFYRQLKERLLVVPGVDGVANSDGLPPHPKGLTTPTALELDDGSVRALGDLRLPFVTVDAEYFEVLGIPILAGRTFGPEDAPGGPLGVIVDPDLAEVLAPGGSALGRRFRIDPDDPWLTVVGVAGDVAMMGPDDRRAPYTLYYSSSQKRPWKYRSIAIRAREAPGALAGAVRDVVRELDPAQPIGGLAPAQEVYGSSLDRQRLVLALMAGFSGVALLLAGIGVYGVIAYVVAQRTREVGVRLALGASPGSVVRHVLVRGLGLAAVGATVGTGAALLLSRYAASLLFRVEPDDPATFALVGAVLVAVSASAALVPALRAGRLNPVQALRRE